MSTIATRQRSRGAAAQTASPAGYDPVLKSVHWATVALIAGMLATVWLAHSATSRGQHEQLIELHRSLGLAVLGLSLFRLGWRWRARVPRLPADLPRLQAAGARAVHAMLYALLILQPLLGLVHSNAHGVRVSFFGLLTLPALVARDKWLAKQALAAHEAVATVLLVVIGLHAAAALFHHFVRRDDVLLSMLPRRRPNAKE